MSSEDLRKNIRFHILIDKPFKKMVELAAHESWVSVGQYMRDTVALFDGVNFDSASDIVMIGKEVGLEGLENLRIAAERKGVSVKQFCESLTKQKPVATEPDEPEESVYNVDQISLF